MGKTISDVCARTDICDSNENIVREFQQKALTFHSRDGNNRGQSFSMVPKITSTRDSEWLSSMSTLNSSERYEKYPSSSFIDYQQDSSSESLLYNEDSENLDGKVEKSISQLCTNFSSQDELEKGENVGCSLSEKGSKQDDCHVIEGDGGSMRDSMGDIPTLERIRSNAMQSKLVEAPQGKFLSEHEFYIQTADCNWERVCIESWNPWNGTWQVRGEDGMSFPAAPIALKTKQEYEFLSRERVFMTRSFGSYQIHLSKCWIRFIALRYVLN